MLASAQGTPMDHPKTRDTDLSPLLAPRTVALVGATDHPTSFGGRVFRQMTNFGFKGKIYPVNPRLANIDQYACYPSVKNLPETPDHVGIIISTARVFDILEECAQIGVRFATVFSGGFSETGTAEGRELQKKLVRFARSNNMRIMGPNCNGVVNFVDGFAMTSTAAIKGVRAAPGDVGVVCHSGGLGQINVMWRAQQIGLGISYEASCGNEADIDTMDFARFMLRSESTKVVLMAIEGIKDGEKFKEIAREAAEREKPIVMLKFGRTAAGQKAAASHTGALAGDNDIVDAVLKQYGVIRVNECNELYETAVFLRQHRWPRGLRAASVAATGGNIVQVADAGGNIGIQWPEYSNKTQDALADLMPGYGKVANPTDMTSLATGDQVLYRKALTAIAEDADVDVLIPIFASVPKADLVQGAELIAKCSKPAAMLWVGGCTDDASFTARELVNGGIAVYRDATPCVRAVRAAVDFGRHVAQIRNGTTKPDRPPGLNQQAAFEMFSSFGEKLTEREAKQLLHCYGLPVTREQLATSAAQAVELAGTFAAEVALKIDSSDIQHKTEAGAIRLGLRGAKAVSVGFDQVVESAKRYSPNARINGVLVQEMARPGVELILGVIRDPSLGPIVAVGMGGIYVEVLKDVSYRAAPVNHLQASEMLDELRAAKLLEGVRGMGSRDRNAVIDAIVRLSWFAHDFRDEVAELDINPLIVYETRQGARVVDALITRHTQSGE
jgi:acyl-CoA synthetase (NDP forming)